MVPFVIFKRHHQSNTCNEQKKFRKKTPLIGVELEPEVYCPG